MLWMRYVIKLLTSICTIAITTFLTKPKTDRHLAQFVKTNTDLILKHTRPGEDLVVVWTERLEKVAKEKNVDLVRYKT